MITFFVYKNDIVKVTIILLHGKTTLYPERKKDTLYFNDSENYIN